MLRSAASTARARLTSAAGRRGYAADAHGEAKVAYPWQAPSDPAKWKEEHLVFTVLGGWAVAIWTATKVFGGGGKKEAPITAVPPPPPPAAAAAPPAAAPAAAAPVPATAK